MGMRMCVIRVGIGSMHQKGAAGGYAYFCFDGIYGDKA